MSRILVTDGEERSALAVTRSLGRAGHEVHVAGSTPKPLAAASKHAVGQHRVPSPLEEPRAFVEAVAASAQREEAAVVLPVTDPSALAVLEHRAVLDGVQVPLPSLPSFRAASDKAQVAELARHVGLAAPAYQLVPDRGTAERIDVTHVPFPVVVKGATSVAGDGSSRWMSRVAYASTPDALRQVLSGIPADGFPVLLQERVQGAGMGIFLLLWDGELLAHFGHRRIREKPPTGGVSVLRESVPVESELLAAATNLLRGLGWRGVAMVELKVDAASGRPYVLEVNGRFWGSLQLARDAGVDFPRLLVDAALGRPLEPLKTYRPGVRSRWLWGDTDHLFIRLKNGADPCNGLGSRIWSAGRALGAYMAAFRPGTKCEILRVRDPGPFVRESHQRIRAVTGQRGRQ